jgi:hypothetical protein
MSAEYVYVVADYFATGEGVTKALLVTCAYPSTDDLDENYEPYYGKNIIALKQFDKIFGEFLGKGAEVVSKEDFLKNYDRFIPAFTRSAIDGGIETPGNFQWSAKMHINYS